MTRLASLALVALVALVGLGGPSPASAAPPKKTDLALVMAIARKCVLGPPYDGKGPDKVRLDLTPIALGRPRAATTWGVTFVQAEHPPRSAVTVQIDPVAGTCDGRRVVATSPAPHLVDIDALLAGARHCAEGAPWFGVGVSRSPLVYARASIQYHPFDAGMTVSFPEKTPTTDPSGLDLSIDFDGVTCGAVFMD